MVSEEDIISELKKAIVVCDVEANLKRGWSFEVAWMCCYRLIHASLRLPEVVWPKNPFKDKDTISHCAWQRAHDAHIQAYEKAKENQNAVKWPEKPKRGVHP